MPHSCGEVCGRALAVTTDSVCPHTCLDLCHPGPCEPCQASLRKTCPCGALTRLTRCDTALLCGGDCGKLLNCGRHACTALCHEGPCQDCQLTVEQGKTSPLQCRVVLHLSNADYQSVTVGRPPDRRSAVLRVESSSPVKESVAGPWTVANTSAALCVTRVTARGVLSPPPESSPVPVVGPVWWERRPELSVRRISRCAGQSVTRSSPVVPPPLPTSARLTVTWVPAPPVPSPPVSDVAVASWTRTCPVQR